MANLMDHLRWIWKKKRNKKETRKKRLKGNTKETDTEMVAYREILDISWKKQQTKVLELYVLLPPRKLLAPERSLGMVSKGKNKSAIKRKPMKNKNMINTAYAGCDWFT